MKLIIDIPEDIYKTSKEIEAKYEGSVNIPLELIANGTPLDDVKAENDKLLKYIQTLKTTKEVCKKNEQNEQKGK